MQHEHSALRHLGDFGGVGVGVGVGLGSSTGVGSVGSDGNALAREGSEHVRPDDGHGHGEVERAEGVGRRNLH